MAERTASLRVLVQPLRRDPTLKPVGDAFENAQVQLDAIVKRLGVLESADTAVSGTSDVTADPPGPITDIEVTSTIVYDRNVPLQKLSVTAKAPATSFNDFTGVIAIHNGVDRQTSWGWIPMDVAPGDDLDFDVYVPVPYDAEQTETLVLVACNADVIAAYADSPETEIIAPYLPDDTLKDVLKQGDLTYEWQANGDLRLTALRADSAGYIPPWIGNTPSNIGTFLGVDIFFEPESNPLSPYSAGSPPYTGTPGGASPTNYGEINVTIPRGYITEGTHYLILRSYGQNSRLGFKRHQLLPDTCYWAVVVSADDLTDNPSGGTTPADPTGVTAFTRPGSTPARYYPGVRFTPPVTLGGTVGYTHAYRFWKDSGKSVLHWPTDGSWIQAGDVDGARITEITADEAWRDSITVYLEARVRGYNDQREYGAWVVSSNAAEITAAGSDTAGQAASVSIKIGAGMDSRTYSVAATFTPPSPLGLATGWEPQLGFFDAETSGTQTHPYTPLGGNLDIYDTSETFGPFTRGVDESPWAAFRLRIVYADGSKGDWIYADRKQVAKQAAPTPTVTNLSSIETDTINGKPSYRIVKKATFNGSKDAVDWTEMKAWFYTDVGGTTLDGEVDLGGIDPNVDATWPVTVEQKTDWWDRPDYAVWWKIGIRVKNSDGVAGSWVYVPSSGLTAMAATTGFDASGIAAGTLGTTLVVSGGKLTNYALTELAKWGLDADDFDGTNPGNLQLNNAVIARLLTQSITLAGTMTILDSGGNQNIRLDSTGILLGTSARYLNLHSGGIDIVEGTSRLDMSASAIQMKISGTTFVDVTTLYTVVSNVFQVKSGGTAYMTVDSSKCQLQVEFEPWGTLDFTNAGSVSMGSKASDWRTALNVSQKVSVTGKTVPLAKLTAGGTNGSITYDSEGRVTSSIDPT